MDENVTDVPQEVTDAETEAAFTASFNDAAEPIAVAPATAEVAQDLDEKQELQATPTAPPASGLSEDQIKLLSAIPELERRLTQQVDKVSGNYGELKRLLDTMQKSAATPQGAAAFDASADGNYIDEEFPEFANGVNAKIQQAFSKIPAGITAEQFEAMYAQRRQHEDTEKRNELIGILEKAHPDRVEIQQTPQWAQWMDGLTEYQRASVLGSEDPYYVSGMLSKFKAHRDKQAQASIKSKQRIESAITPNGVRPSGPSTISEEEAAQKAFEAQFN